MSYDFTGSDYFTGSAMPVSAEPFTIHCFVQFGVLNANDVIVGFENGTSGDFYSLLIKGGTASDPVWFQASDAGVAQEAAVVTASPSTGTWYSVAGTAAGDPWEDRNLYFDTGTGQSTLTVTPDTMDTFLIGSGGGASEFDGLIAEVAVWDIVLSSGEIASLRGGTNPQDIQSGNLVSYHPLETNTTATVGSITLSATGSPTQDAAHPTVSAPSSGSILPNAPFDKPFNGPFGGPF